MRHVWLWVVGLAFVAGSWSVAHSAVIITTKGEEIICEIVKETDTYLIIDHRGYRRYVLKSNIRTLNREAGEGYRLGQYPLRFISIAGGYELYGKDHQPGFSGGRLTIGFPINRLVLIEGNLHVGRSRIDSPHGQGDPMSGPVYWTGATVGGLWQLNMGRISPLLEAGIGYFFLDHAVDESEVQTLRDYFGTQDMNYTESFGSGFGFTMGFGASMRLSPRFALVMRTSVLVIHSEFETQWHFLDDEGNPSVMGSSHGLLMQTVQTHMGIRMNF